MEEQQFYVTGGDTPPEDAAENSIFLRASDQTMYRYVGGEWINVNDPIHSKIEEAEPSNKKGKKEKEKE